MEIELSKQRGTPPLRCRARLLAVLRLAQECAGLGQFPGRLHLVITTAATMTRLNEDFLGHHGLTDVLTFDLRTEEPAIEDDPEACAAEIYVSPDYAASVCRSFGNSCSRELVLYMIHGMLHLAGEDDLEDAPRQAMRAAETRVLTELERHYSLEGFLDSPK